MFKTCGTPGCKGNSIEVKRIVNNCPHCRKPLKEKKKQKKKKKQRKQSRHTNGYHR